MIIVITAAVSKGRTTGGVIGFAAGLLQDWFSGGLFGIHSISKIIIGYLCGFLREHIYQNHFLTPPLITLLATLIDQLFILFFTNFLLEITFLKYVFKSIIIPLAIWNSIMSLLLYPLINKLEKILARRKFW